MELIILLTRGPQAPLIIKPKMYILSEVNTWAARDKQVVKWKKLKYQKAEE
jgi:hypothetical protein